MTKTNTYIDHTNLSPSATDAEIDKLCQEAREHQFATVCVYPLFVKQCVRALQDTKVGVCTVVNFPYGTQPQFALLEVVREALADGATEIDTVINVDDLKAGRHKEILDSLFGIAHVVHERGVILKVIIETGLLTDDEKRTACQLAARAGADFVKTCTGKRGGQATVSDILLMRTALDEVEAFNVKIKASGGIRTYEAAAAMVKAGADRIGTSSGVAIMRGVPTSHSSAAGTYAVPAQ